MERGYELMERGLRGDIELILTNELGLRVEVVKRGGLLTTGAIESFDLITLISLLEERFAVDIAASSIIPTHFDSVDSMAALVADLRNGS